ncbi:MAG: AEC family transporter [Rhodospirillales bacterium]|nr:AEC family transporter [Rhodospirillales bacterium]
MSPVVGGLAPIFLLIALGLLLRIRGLFTVSFWQDLERLVFYFLFPALLLSSIASADLSGLEMIPMAGALIGATLIVSAAALAIKPKLPLSGDVFVSIFQGLMRPNTYLGLSIAAALYGEAGIALIAVCIVAIIPLVNFLAVIAHLRWAADRSVQTGNADMSFSRIPWRTVLSSSQPLPLGPPPRRTLPNSPANSSICIRFIDQSVNWPWRRP